MIEIATISRDLFAVECEWSATLQGYGGGGPKKASTVCKLFTFYGQT